MGLTAGITMAGSSLASGISESESARAQGQFQRDQAYLNAGLAERQAQESIEQGNADARVARRKTNATAGSQKVAAAAMGLDISEGAPAEAIDQTMAVGAVEEMNIRTNAWRQAWGFKVSAATGHMEGDMAKSAGDSKANQTLIAGGMQALSYGAQGYSAGRNTGGGKSTATRERSYAGGTSRATNRFD